jgi:hypothetical protein
MSRNESLKLSQTRDENMGLYRRRLREAKDAAASDDPKAKDLLEAAGGAAGRLFDVYLGARGELSCDMSEIERLLGTSSG